MTGQDYTLLAYFVGLGLLAGYGVKLFFEFRFGTKAKDRKEGTAS